MLVEINLLPQKSKKSKVIFIILAVFIVLAALILSFFIWQVKAKEAQIAEVQNRIDVTMNIIAEKNKQLEDYHSATSVQELEQAIKWAETKEFDSVFLLDELTKMLPERGFILDFKMDSNYKINQVLQFDTRSDAAYYLHTLLSNEWVEEAVISQANSNELNLGGAKEDENLAVNYYNEDNTLPRYRAQYEIILNLEKFAEAAAEDKQQRKGEEQS